MESTTENAVLPYGEVAIKNIQMLEKMKQDFTGCVTQSEIKEMDITAHIKIRTRLLCREQIMLSSFYQTLLGSFGGQPEWLLALRSFQRVKINFVHLAGKPNSRCPKFLLF